MFISRLSTIGALRQAQKRNGTRGAPDQLNLASLAHAYWPRINAFLIGWETSGRGARAHGTLRVQETKHIERLDVHGVIDDLKGAIPTIQLLRRPV
jgi:hypothetical protein